jgi:hypothetical protein
MCLLAAKFWSADKYNTQRQNEISIDCIQIEMMTEENFLTKHIRTGGVTTLTISLQYGPVNVKVIRTQAWLEIGRKINLTN